MDKTKLKNFRFDQTDIQNLKTITESINAIAERNVNETKVVRALLQIGTRLDPEQILETMRTELL